MVTVSIAEAALRLGVSEKTIRRRLGGGELRGESFHRWASSHYTALPMNEPERESKVPPTGEAPGPPDRRY